MKDLCTQNKGLHTRVDRIGRWYLNFFDSDLNPGVVKARDPRISLTTIWSLSMTKANTMMLKDVRMIVYTALLY